jgi:hypothetical protein
MTQGQDMSTPDQLPATAMRRVRQPGPALEPRAVVVPSGGAWHDVTLEPGLTLVAAIGRALGGAGAASAVLELSGGGFGPFQYVIPALSKTPDHAAFYSDVLAPPGVTRLEAARVTFGLRDGAAWLHAHGFWVACGQRTGGHVMPHETIIAEPIAARAWLLHDAAFVARHDPETNFTLFAPEATGSGGTASLAVRLRPNQDICHALEQICAVHGITGARITGGVASIIGARFDDGRVAPHFATEMFIRAGEITRAGAILDVALIDCTGSLHEGRLARGLNPVLMTTELALVTA